MSTLCAVADWLASLNPFALAFLTCAVIAALGLMAFGAALVYFWIVSGAGECNDGEVESETYAPGAKCLRSVCAWCHPVKKGDNITHGICPAHAAELRKEAGL